MRSRKSPAEDDVEDPSSPRNQRRRRRGENGHRPIPPNHLTRIRELRRFQKNMFRMVLVLLCLLLLLFFVAMMIILDDPDAIATTRGMPYPSAYVTDDDYDPAEWGRLAHIPNTNGSAADPAGYVTLSSNIIDDDDIERVETPQKEKKIGADWDALRKNNHIHVEHHSLQKTSNHKADDFSKDFFFQTVWPDIQKDLCPNGPNTNQRYLMHRTLFRLARNEVLEKNDTRIAHKAFWGDAEHLHPTKLVESFYGHAWNASVYHGASSGFQTVRMVIPGSSEDQIRDMEQELFRSSEHSKHLDGTYINETFVYEALQNVGLWQFPSNKAHDDFVLLPLSEAANKPKVSPCIYTAVRDPIDHFLSGYNDIERGVLRNYLKLGTTETNDDSEFESDSDNEQQSSPHAPYHVVVPYVPDDFDANMDPLEKIDEMYFNHLNRKNRFVEFVTDFLREEARLLELNQRDRYDRVFSQVRILSTLQAYNHTKLTGYMPYSSNFDVVRTWPRFLSDTCPGAPPLDELVPRNGFGGFRQPNVMGGDPLGTHKAAQSVWKEGGSISRALCLLHAFDYACFPELPLPDPCQKVYHQHATRLSPWTYKRRGTAAKRNDSTNGDEATVKSDVGLLKEKVQLRREMWQTQKTGDMVIRKKVQS